MTANVAPGADASIIIKDFKVCNGKDGLKKDTPVVTIPMASLDIGKKKKDKKDKKGKAGAGGAADDASDTAIPETPTPAVEVPPPANPAQAPPDATPVAVPAPATPPASDPPAAPPAEEVKPEDIGGSFAPNGQRLPSPKKPSSVRYLRA